MCSRISAGSCRSSLLLQSTLNVGEPSSFIPSEHKHPSAHPRCVAGLIVVVVAVAAVVVVCGVVVVAVAGLSIFQM